MTMRWTKSLLNFFYPNRCPACGAFIGVHELVCTDCGDKLLIPQDSYCHFCGKAACVCKERTFSYDRVVICSPYTDNAISAIVRLKRSENTNFAVYAAQILAGRLAHGECYYKQFDCVMPVPMHRSKKRTRGYNQASLIGKELARLMEIPYREDLLQKQHSRREQHQLRSLEERVRNTESFFIRDCDLSGMRILLCDDVLTTGSTLDRCAGLLKEKGARSVTAAAAVTTVPKNWKNPLKQEETT